MTLVLDSLKPRLVIKDVLLLGERSQEIALPAVSLKELILESGQPGRKKRLTNWSKVLRSMGWEDGRISSTTRNYIFVKVERIWILRIGM